MGIVPEPTISTLPVRGEGVIHAGGHVGALAASWAIPRKIEVTACSADEMLELLPDVLLVFRGAEDLVQCANDAGVRVVEVR